MKGPVIMNTVLVWLILIFMIIKPYLQKFTIEINRTLWEKKPYGFHITKWEYKKGTSPNNGARLFNFNWRNPDKISDDIKKATKYHKSYKK
jgi:hypothetical protein